MVGTRRKALLPLYFLMILSFGTFEFDVDNIEARSGSVSTYFLAAFAMLYVVGEALPKTDFLTKIDKVRANALGGVGVQVCKWCTRVLVCVDSLDGRVWGCGWSLNRELAIGYK